MSDVIQCDLVVVGAGMAGMTAAGLAAEKGAQVVVVERAPDIGGSALLSGGYVWTCTSPGHMAFNDDGDPKLQSVVLSEFPNVIAWIRQSGAEVRPPQRVLFGRGYQIDMAAYLKGCELLVGKAGGLVARGTETLEIIRESGRVAGVRTRHPDGDIEVRAGAVLLATGGFQASPELRAELIHPLARDIILRSNRFSDGGGLRLGVAAGGSYAGPNPGFYGHLLAHPVKAETSSHFVNFTQYHSDHAVLLNLVGQRYVDESRADHTSSQWTLRQPEARALLVWDQRVQSDVVVSPPVAGAEPLDRYDIAIKAGAHGAIVQRLEDIAAFAVHLGYDGRACVRSLQDYNAGTAAAPERLQPARIDNAVPLLRAPYYVLEVRPAITFSFGGLAVDDQARVLDPAGIPVPGLLAAGADVGNVYRGGYAGGLALASTFAYRAMRTLGYAQ